MRTFIVGILVILTFACSSTNSPANNQASDNFLVPIPFQVQADRLLFNSFVPICEVNCRVKLTLDIQKYDQLFTYYPFAAFALHDREQNFSARIQVEFSPARQKFEYSVVTKQGSFVVNKVVISEHDLPDMFEFYLEWDAEALSVTPYTKEVGEGWFKFVPSANATEIDLQFTPYSYGYLASGTQGRFLLNVGEQNILDLKKQAVRVSPIQKNDL